MQMREECVTLKSSGAPCRSVAAPRALTWRRAAGSKPTACEPKRSGEASCVWHGHQCSHCRADIRAAFPPPLPLAGQPHHAAQPSPQAGQCRPSKHFTAARPCDSPPLPPRPRPSIIMPPPRLPIRGGGPRGPPTSGPPRPPGGPRCSGGGGPPGRPPVMGRAYLMKKFMVSGSSRSKG